MAKKPLPPLLYADTASSADQLYFSRVSVHDPFIAFGVGQKRFTVQNALEFGRVLKARSFDKVLPLEAWVARARKRHPDRKVGPAEIIAELAKAHRLPGFRVADDFPAALFLKLRDLGLHIELADGPLFPEREVKTPREAAALREGNRLSSIGFTVAEDILRQSRIRKRELIFEGKVLTSERVQFAIASALMANGGHSEDTIVAGGNQACDPHERGHGPLRPNEMIIVDIFPRVTKTGYFGDMTRTYLKGRASAAQRKLYATVHEAQRAAIKAVRTGVDGREVHQQVLNVFESAGFQTKHGKQGSVGFFHGTGHGLGLAVHEVPRVSTVPYTLVKGSVVTIEPGLYYPGLGGCRIEDVVQVTDRGAKLLSSHHYDWEIK
ncbi:MAG: Xaa-Pro peptidase family protein [Cephaloticoccus sp.]|nr:Xaa-Pro peptidase family protein [Cephaloticoccus sp.]MCF7760006.1 Xaa-Pro peptidase family protein [Cephaloticoccus sp.]